MNEKKDYDKEKNDERNETSSASSSQIDQPCIQPHKLKKLEKEQNLSIHKEKKVNEFGNSNANYFSSINNDSDFMVLSHQAKA